MQWLGVMVVCGVGACLGGCGDDAQSDTTSGSSNSGGSGAAGAAGPGGSGATGTGATGNGGAGANGGSAGSGGTAGAGAGGSGPLPPIEPVRFVAMGDGGEGNPTQYAVAAVVKDKCDAAGGCDFALYLGDNIYDTGVDSVDDPQFQTKFEMPYADLTFPFHVVLGNHDYGGGGAGYEFYKGQFQIDYTAMSTKWSAPDFYYTFSTSGAQAGVDFFGLDTNSIMYTGASEQKAWLDSALAAATGTWKIAFGHHTYISNGQHGNAGEYEGLPVPLPIVSGQNVKSFVDSSVCGKADLYVCGHDHNRQWLQPTCGTEFIVVGTAAKNTDLAPKGTPTFFEEDGSAGFVLIEIVGNSLTGTFYNELGDQEFTRTVTK